MDEPEDLLLPSGATVQYFLDRGAPPGAGLLVFHHGTPAAGPLDPDLVGPARAAGLQIVELVRPGYGGSTRAPGRSVADVVPLVAALVDHLGHDRFVSLGWSGGGPHVLATAALMPHRCAAALCLAGIAPYGAEGLDYLAGMGQDNIIEFSATLEGTEALQPLLEQQAAGLAAVTGPEVTQMLGSLLPPVDREHLTGETGDQIAAELRWSVSTGIWGWFDDDIAFVTPWGFELEAVSAPVQVWQGSEDLMVPFAHGQWLAAHVPGAMARLERGEGHLSLVTRISEGMGELRRWL